MNRAAAPALSVVVPVYNEAGNVEPLSAEIREVMQAVGRPFEVIFVNDGSTDATLQQLHALAAREPNLRIIDLDGNCGEAAALCAGFRAARGELVITLDGDGQNDPHDIPQLLDRLERSGYRVVSGRRRERQEGLLLRVWPSRLANALIAAVTGIPMHDNGCGLKAYRRPVVANAALPPGMNRFMPAIFGVTADEVAEVPVSDRQRRHGQSHYGFGRTLVVLRDLLALPFIVRNPQRSESAWSAAIGASLIAHAYGRWTHYRWLTVFSGAVVVLGSTIWWNLHRFNRAQRDGVYRVRREYTRGPATGDCQREPEAPRAEAGQA